MAIFMVSCAAISDYHSSEIPNPAINLFLLLYPFVVMRSLISYRLDGTGNVTRIRACRHD
ncbi:MAG: hypothetical protein COB93_07620 [Sneathiella sp.]|nr:MAG: hypothetical protein COB93_07620 [Sneathiella sp.]